MIISKVVSAGGQRRAQNPMGLREKKTNLNWDTNKSFTEKEAFEWNDQSFFHLTNVF